MFDVIIVGGSYAGLSAAMSLGRSLRKALLIDSGKPCNRTSPHTHNFLTRDGESPHFITEKAREQVKHYDTVRQISGIVSKAEKQGDVFQVELDDGTRYTGKKLLFATGLKDILPSLKGFRECWGKSVLHCPYCHGYEVRNSKLGILASGEAAADLCKLIQHWTDDLTLFTNGKPGLPEDQLQFLKKLNIDVVEKGIEELVHKDGKLSHIVFRDGSSHELEAIFTKVELEQHCKLPMDLGCELNNMGYLDVHFGGYTTVDGVFAAGDNANPMRSIAMAVYEGNFTGAIINMELIKEQLAGE